MAMESRRSIASDLPTGEEREEINPSRKENFDLRSANEILKAASTFSRPSSTQTGRSERLSTRIATVSASSRSAGLSGFLSRAYYQRPSGQHNACSIACFTGAALELMRRLIAMLETVRRGALRRPARLAGTERELQVLAGVCDAPPVQVPSTASRGKTASTSSRAGGDSTSCVGDVTRGSY